MPSKLEFTVFDGTTKTPMSGVTIQLKELVTNNIIDTQITDTAGKTIFNLSQGALKYTIFKSGFRGRDGTLYITALDAKYNLELYQEPTTEQPPIQQPPDPPQFPSKPGEIIPRRAGEYHNDYIGTRCEVVTKSMFNQQFWAYRDMYTGIYGKWESAYHNAPDAANANPGCFAPAPPTPADWQTGIEQQIKTGFDGITKYVTDGLKGAADDTKKGLIDLEGGLKTWIQDSFLGKIEAVTSGLAGLAAKVETIAANRLKELLDLESRLKAWISSNILELLLLKLMEK